MLDLLGELGYGTPLGGSRSPVQHHCLVCLVSSQSLYLRELVISHGLGLWRETRAEEPRD
jgi:hypothetical protein